MARTLRTVGVIAGAVALTATGLGAIGVPAILGFATTGVGVSIATVAGLASAAAGTAATVIQKAPPARGNVTQLIIAPDVPQPYVMGEGYYAGVLRHDAAYGATLNDVPNPYRGMVVVYSGGGPTESITPYVDKAAVTSYYTGYLYTDTQLGDTPEASALAPHYAGLPGWDASSKLSGQAAILWNLLFDKKGKRFASGVPQIGAYGQWVKAYDARLDSTFPGGSGTHRLNDETTWEWTENPALHFGTYAYGRHQNGVRTIGCGLTSIDWGVIAAWANVCEANGWTIFGVVYEPGNRWDNLKDIAAAGGGVPVVSSGGLLSVKYWAPQVSLDTISAADLADGQVTYSPLQSWDDRVNTIVPRYTSADNEWNQVAAEPVAIAGFVTEDGEEKRKEWPYNLVKDAGQAAQLASYQIYDGREINPIVIPCGPRMRAYRPGECLTINLPDYGLELDAIILNRALDPATMTVTLTLIGETPDKHAAALGQTPAPPAVPVAGQDGEDRDETIYDTAANPPREVANEAALLALSVPIGTVVKRTDNKLVYFYNGGTSGTIADWTVLATSNTAASGISFAPAGAIAATNVQAAIQELDTEKAALAGATFTGPVIVLNSSGLKILDTDASHTVGIVGGSNLTADRTLTLTTGDANRTLDISAGNVTISAVGATLVSQTTQALMRSTGLGLGTSAVIDTGTSGTKVPLLDGANTWSANQTFGAGTGNPVTAINSGTGTNEGAHLRFNKGGTITGYVGLESGIVGGTASHVIVYAITGNDVKFYANAAHTASVVSGGINLLSGKVLSVNGTQVVGARQTGWGAATGTATRTAIATYTAPTITNPPTQAEVQAIANALQAWSRRDKALSDDLTTTGIIGP